MMRKLTALLAFVGLVVQSPGQNGEAPRYEQTKSVAADRVEDSYVIYSQLLKSGPIEWRDAKRAQWLIEDTTSAMPLSASCGPGVESLTMNPHSDVEPPNNRLAEWREVLADYDQHCHDVLKLDRERFRTELPVNLLNADDKRIFMKDPIKPPAEFADGAGLHRFTEVFFNSNHTLALVEQGMWCGGECGNWTWVVLERRQDRWVILPWAHTVTVS